MNGCLADGLGSCAGHETADEVEKTTEKYLIDVRTSVQKADKFLE